MVKPKQKAYFGTIWKYLKLFDTTVGFFMFKDFIHPKFSLPVPLYLPFKEQATWSAFVTTVLYQTIVSIDTATLALYLYGIIICIYAHILGYLDMIQEATEQMKHEMLTSHQDCDKWAQIINEMISDVNSFISSFGKLFAVPLLFIEIASLGSLFICGLIVTVVQQQYFFAVGITIACCKFFIHCYVNEQILEKLENINRTLYDMPWYNFQAKPRKTLMLLMHCNKIQRGFTAAGIHNLTFERFGIDVKVGYTNLLILQDLVQK